MPLTVLYSAFGPSRTFDPATYYRMQPWRAFLRGGCGTFYWALGAACSGTSWNAYAQKGTEYSPYFASKTDVTPAKQSEAIRESIQDFEYLSPTLREMAVCLGVSTRVTKEAVAKLSAEGVVCARPRVGTVVARPGSREWRGHVVILNASADMASYVFAARTHSMTDRLNEAGYLVTQSSGEQLEHVLSHPVDFIVCPTWLPSRVMTRVRASGIPWMYPPQHRSSLAAFVAHCVAAGVKTVERFDIGGSATFFAKAFANVGIGVRRHIITTKADPLRLENIKRRAMERMARRLSDGRPLPDVFYFDDDFIAFGALVALLAAAVRIPEDVKVVTLENRGFAPVFPKSLTRLVHDPHRDGVLLADYVIARLTGATSEPMGVLPPFDYVRGESFP